MIRSWITQNRLKFTVVCTLAALTIVRLVGGAQAELLPEEAYYWMYWKHPALSYSDHPPMVAWIIGLGGFDTELGVRLGFILLALGSAGLLYRTGRIWFDEPTALWAVLFFCALPIFAGTSQFAFPDGPLIFFWLLTIYSLSKAVHPTTGSPRPPTGAEGRREQRVIYWLLAGVAFGAALLSKYTAVILAPSLFLFLLLSQKHRVWLRRPEPWLALVVAFLVFSPVLVWNARHDWASFRFQTSRTANPHSHMLRDVGMFWFMQIGILTPLVFGLCGVAAVRALQRGWRQRDDRWVLVGCFFWPLFLVFVWASFKTEIHVNWTAPVYLSLLWGAGALMTEGLKGPRARWWKRAGAVTAGICCVVMVLAITTLTWGIPPALTYRHSGGWRELGNQIEVAEHALEKRTGQKVFTIGVDKYNLAAQLGFYTREPDEQINTYALGKQGLGFRYWRNLDQLEGQAAVAVLHKLNRELLAELKDDFDRTDEPRRLEVSAGGGRKRVVYMIDCYGFHAKPDDDFKIAR